MKINMAEGEYFSIGSTVSCITCYNQNIRGEVLAFDHGSKMLAIKSAAASGKQNSHDIKLVNLNFVSDVKVLSEATETAPPPTSLNVQKIAQRIHRNVEEKQRKVDYIGQDVSQEAQKVFNAITKTIQDVRWMGKNINVMDQVLISHPYGVEHCVMLDKGTDQALQHVKKIVARYHGESSESRQGYDGRKSLSPSPASSASS
ncbi:protein LSM12-like [Liolophura sinensis]|uniref:protein LSM12-like n=1 Tax=Liolophura sinensis TaxID=3198878 RepID=UPI00315858E7